MSQKKIADLTEVQSVDENLCYVPVDNGSATVKIKLKNLEESATESAESYAQAAAASATSASGYADAAALSSASASTYATNASESAQDAALSAGSASDSADAAAVSASNAASSASNVAAIVTDVSQQAAVALASAEEAKSWAVGGTDTRAGEDTDNAKWYSIQAGASATNAAASESNAATSEANAAASESNAATSETNASSSETNAATSATNAASSETNAGASATAAALSEEKAALSRAAAATSSEDAEAWSVGTRNNVPVPSTDPAYNNNAKYWAEAAAGAAGGGVTSFNGRAGAVSSQAHDYSANQVDFNNADNGFTATNTQAAIEEVAGNLSDLDTSLASVAKSGSYNDLSNTPNLATVATSGSYADLSNTPTLGTAAAKNSTNTISSGSSDLIESGPVYSLKQTLETNIQALTNNTYNVNDTAITEVASNDLLPIYDTSASGKKKIAVDNFIGRLVSNPNLLDNPWFTVNQRGSTSYTLAQNKYGFDRWCANSGGEIISKSDDTISLNGSTTNQYSGLAQRVERDRLKVGETYTLSILFSDGEVESRTFTLTSSGTNFLGSWNHAPKFNAVITSSSSNTLWGILPFDALANLDATVSFKAIKMEKGSVSTLAMDTAPNYMEELAKCQRYFVRYSAKDYHGTYAALAMGWVDRTDNTKAMVLLPTPVPMRRVAAMTYSGSLKILPGEIAISSIVSDGTDSIVNTALLVTMGTALTTNQPISLWIRNDASAFIDLSADL